MTKRDLAGLLEQLLHPVRTRLANIAARAVVRLVKDATNLQSLQLGVLADEDIDDAENFQQYGFSSVPMPGAEAVAVFPNGDRGHPLVIATADRRYRPTGRAPGEVTLYTKEGDEIHFAAGHIIRIKTTGSVEIGFAPGETPGPLDGVVHGSGIDPWTGQTYTALQNASAVVKAKK